MNLPKGWFHRHGAYYWRVPRPLVHIHGKTQVRLGKTFSESLRAYADLVDENIPLRTMQDIFSRYTHEVTLNKAKTVQRNQLSQLDRLSRVFGKMPPSRVEKQHIYGYLDARRDAPVSANRDVALLSAIFRKAIRWGAVRENPCLGVEKHKETPRDRYVTDEELKAFYDSLESPMLKAYVKLKYITGQRQQDILNIRLSDITEDGIYFTNQKTNKRFLMEWTDELKRAVSTARRVKRRVGTLYLFAGRTGARYTGDGFRSLWQRAMRNYCAKGHRRFTEHDLRAKTASDTNAEHAQEILRHNSIAFTEKVYRRQLKKVRPLK